MKGRSYSSAIAASLIAVLFLFSTLFFYQPAAKAAVFEGTVNATELNVRSSPSTTASIVVKLKKNQAVSVLEQKSDWYKIQFDKKTGWVSLKYITKKTAQPAVASKTVYVKTADLNLRAAPNTSSKVITKLKKDTALTVISVSGKWTQVSVAKQKGWVSNDHISAAKQGPEVKSSTAKTAYVKASSLNVRTAPNTTSKVVATLKKDAQVTIVSTSGKWNEITFAKQKGWVSGEHLTTQAPAPAKAAPKAETKQAKVSGTATLNVRSGPSTNEKVVGTLKQNDLVTVSKTSGTWSYISASKITGWVATQYLASPSAAQPSKEKAAEPILQFVTLLADAEIKAGPDNTQKTISQQPAGAVFVKVEVSKGWVKVQLSSNQFGWVEESLTISEVTAPAPIPPAAPASVLKGKIIVIDPGHGGTDPGAVGRITKEKNLCLTTSLFLAEMLRNEGAKVIMTREKDVYPSLSERVAISNKSNGDAFISVHYNAHTSTSTGTMTFYYTDVKDKKLAAALQSGIAANTPLPDKGVRYGNYQVIRNNKIPSALVELGFISNPNEEKILATEDYQRKAAKGMLEGLRKYFEQKK
ncbi:SH3 domain-containing protein [Bacillus lacus]|uniref:SH3 domain-containing protein n=1 Tax=Metabacillus lacus TaxID=1983721 RepID=A0A7X2IYY4_9BACI|nr:SH3 domain-containing protein [Metabacillus lacus]MRX72360.1 SH3 domain-containing protein [Metabacillus lacus]